MNEKQQKKIEMVQERSSLIVGVDIAKKICCARMFTNSGKEIAKTLWFPNNQLGFSKLLTSIEAAKNQYVLSKVIIGFEPTGPYWACFAHWLKKLNLTDLTTVIVNPYHVRQSLIIEDNSWDKVDPKDAKVVISLIRQGKFSFLRLPEGIYARLRELTAWYERNMKNIRRLKNTIHNLITRYFPQYYYAFKDIDGKTSLHFLEEIFLPEKVIEIGEKKLQELLEKWSNNRISKNKAREIIALASNSFGVKEAADIAMLEMKSVVSQLRYGLQEKEKIKHEMEKCLNKIEVAKYPLSIERIPLTTVAEFFGEVLDVSNYDRGSEIIKLAGLNLVENSSGEKKGKKHISKKGRPNLRATAYRGACSLVGKFRNGKYKNPAFGQYYDFLVHEKKLQKPQALTAVAMKLLRVMFKLAKDKLYFDGKKANPYLNRKINMGQVRRDWGQPYWGPMI